jgi:hypothetical protein
MPNSAFPAANQERAARSVEVSFGELQRLADPQTRPPQDHDQRPQPDAIDRATGGAHHRDDLLNGGRVGRIAATFVSRSPTLMKARHGDGSSAMTSGVIQNGLHLALLGR